MLTIGAASSELKETALQESHEFCPLLIQEAKRMKIVIRGRLSAGMKGKYEGRWRPIKNREKAHNTKKCSVEKTIHIRGTWERSAN